MFRIPLYLSAVCFSVFCPWCFFVFFVFVYSFNISFLCRSFFLSFLFVCDSLFFLPTKARSLHRTNSHQQTRKANHTPPTECNQASSRGSAVDCWVVQLAFETAPKQLQRHSVGKSVHPPYTYAKYVTASKYCRPNVRAILQAASQGDVDAVRKGCKLQ